MISNERLRYRSDTIFEEANPPPDRKQPLEWRRSFNTISIDSCAPVVEYLYSANDANDFDAGLGESSPESIKPDVKRTVRLTATIDRSSCRDTINFAAEEEKGSGIYRLTRPPGGIRLFIVGAEATEGRGTFKPGAYPGSAFLVDYEDADNYLCFEMKFPLDFVEEMAAQLKRGDAIGLAVHIAVQSFSYEVDDALREWYHPRDLFIHKKLAPAAITGIRTIPRPAPEETVTWTESADGYAEPQKPIVDLQSSMNTAPISLGGVKAALWTIAAILLLHLLS